MSHTLLSAGAGRLSLWLGGATLALGMFVRITRALIEGDVSAMDSAILLAVAKKRTPWLTITAVDVTPGIDHLGGIVLRLHSHGVACLTGPTGRPPVAYGFGGSRNINVSS
jgi:hypothetical protein